MQEPLSTSTTNERQPIPSVVARRPKRDRPFPVWAMLASTLVLLFFLNWQLVLATSLGMAAMLSAYAAQGWKWQGLALQMQKFLKSANRRLVVSVGTGAIAVLVSSVSLAIWTETESHWLATSTIVQFIATLSVFALVVKHAITQWLHEQEHQFEQIVSQLTATDDLERLIAVRQLAQCIQQNRLPAQQEKAIADYCQILLNRELVPAIREAALETLEALDTRTNLLTKQAAIKPQQ